MCRTTYTVEDIFTDIPDDPDNVLMTIPPEIMENMGWKEGDVLDVSAENGSLVLVKKIDAQGE